MAAEPRVTIIIPSYREPQVEETIARLERVLLREAVICVVHDWGSGVGATLRRGVERATTEWVLFAMADGSEDPLCLWSMIRVCQDGGVDAVFGDRWARGSVTDYPWLKRLANRCGNYALAAAQRRWYFDWTDLAKAYRRERLLQIAWDDDFRCAVQIPLRYTRRWPNFAVVPMHWRERTAGCSSYTMRQALKVLGAAAQEVWR